MLKNTYARIAVIIVLIVILYYLVITLARSVAEDQSGSLWSPGDRVASRLAWASSVESSPPIPGKVAVFPPLALTKPSG